MDSSSESDTYDRPTGHRSRVRKRRTRPDSGFPRDNHVSGISDKIDTLANTLHDTSRNLNKVDRMLGQYKEHTDDQAEAMVTLRESLEESIQHLQAQQLRRSTAGWSASLSTLHTSDLDEGSATDRRHYLPTSPLRDYGSAGTGNRRRSRSVAVRFTDSAQAEEQIHSLHQSLRDLQSDQLRTGDDIDREIRRRNRTDIETKKTLENLAGHIKASQKEEPVSLRVERRLQEIEDEMRTGRQVLSERHHREKPKSMSGELQEALRRHDAETPEADENFRNRLQRSENERSKMQQELERLREQLDQSEGGRDTLLQKMDDMRSQLLRMEKERLDLQRELSLLLSQQKSARRQQERGVTGLDSGRAELEREIEDLRVQLGRISVSSEVEELKKSVERKEREKTQLAFRVEALSADLERREQQQLKMLAQLKEIQSRSEENVSECGRLEAQLIESERRREELRSKAQEAVRQWKTKCKKLEREFQELKDNSRNNTDKDKWSEAVADSELRRALQLKLDKMKTECDKLTEQLSTSEENHAKLLHKYHALKKELDVKGKLAERVEERRQSAEHSMEELHERVTGLQTEQVTILHAVGTRIDSACQFLSKDSAAKLEAITLTPGLQKDSHRWLAEVKTKLQWLCEEVRERESRERRLRRTLQQHKEQMKALKQSKDSELQSFLDRITLQDRLLKDIQSEKRGLLEMGRKKEDEMRNLQDRIVDLEMSTRLALDHLESVPEKLSLLENFKDLEESQKQREMVEQRYAKYKEIVGNLQHQLEESKKRIQEYRDEKSDAACRSLQLTSLTSSLLSQSNFLTDTTLSTHTSPQKPLASPDLESSLTQEHFSTFNGANSKHTSM
ncbi:centrosomal protein of 128 kDa-like isoform X5 [Sinocyclocheilus grahami]|uniref:centrosomal protein of 128 kDa-like isoform X5 n=1 Tax=Sinocyclocheilus grahami TaxID=75366 RepID=UPI0007AC8B39|nr:PREDICTED: centrosomal protein of 128 kDa-like isoform X5 [Sinocyclocheilus grahami]